MRERKHEGVILGAGLAGLSAAYHSGYQVYEERETPGGTAGTVTKKVLFSILASISSRVKMLIS